MDSRMDSEVLIQSLEDVGYSGPMLEISVFDQALQDGAKSIHFTGLVAWLSNQISSFGMIDEIIQPTLQPEDANSFLMEISSFFKELNCKNSKLGANGINFRLTNARDSIILLDFLLIELMTNKILETKNSEIGELMEVTISESITAKNIREMLTSLQFQKPPNLISSELLFKKISLKILDEIFQISNALIGKPLFFYELNVNQWEQIDKLQSGLSNEYKIRREMLLKRLDVTVNSFSWTDKVMSKKKELTKCYQSKRDTMNKEPTVTQADFLGARDDVAVFEKTSNASVRQNTKSRINNVVIGAVPDRGGRPCDQEPPPLEMPSWQKDRVQGPQRSGFGGGGGIQGDPAKSFEKAKNQHPNQNCGSLSTPMYPKSSSSFCKPTSNVRTGLLTFDASIRSNNLSNYGYNTQHSTSNNQRYNSNVQNLNQEGPKNCSDDSSYSKGNRHKVQGGWTYSNYHRKKKGENEDRR